MKIGYVSFRLAGYDGVSLEAERWKQVLSGMGHTVVDIAGELAGEGELIPELHFRQGDAGAAGPEAVEEKFGRVLDRLRPQAVIVANMWSLPLNLPAATGVEAAIRKRGIHTVARNHDFWWERTGLGPFAQMPPTGGTIKQVVINSLAGQELLNRTGETAKVIGDCFDFARPWSGPDAYAANFRADFGVAEGEMLLVQATRIVPRKQIELAAELTMKLNAAGRKAVLLVAGQAGDEGNGYLSRIRQLADNSGGRVRIISDRVTQIRQEADGQRTYTLWDCLGAADWMTYPSKAEGFGNQFLEGIYFRKPIFLNRYEVYKRDLEPLGFKAVTVDGQVSDEKVREMLEWANDPEKTKAATETNLKIATENFSFAAVEKKLRGLGF
jgi:glycosyltransferase involved in cell wall biosynthesis